MRHCKDCQPLGRTVLGWFALFAVCGLLLVTGCQRDNALRIVKLEPAGPLFGDVEDWGTYIDPTETEEPEPVFIVVVPADRVTVGLQYVEIGAGLPTWTPYQAHLKNVTVTYSSPVPTGEDWENTTVTYKTNMVVEADHEGRVTEHEMMLIPSWWKEEYFEINDPEDYGSQAVVMCEIKLSGYDDASMKDVEVTDNMTVEIGSWFDEPARIGQ